MELSSSKQKYHKLDDNPEEMDELVVVVEQNHYIANNPIQRLSHRVNKPISRRNSRFRLRYSDSEVILDHPVYGGPIESPKLFTVPLDYQTKNKLNLFSCTFPVELRGYVSASFYAEVVSTLNHHRLGLSKSGIISPRKSKIFTDVTTYIDTINNHSRHVKWAVNKQSNVKSEYDFGITIEVHKPRSILFTSLGQSLP